MKRINTPEERLAHMQAVQNRLAAQGKKPLAQDALELLGDLSSVSCWRAHDPQSGFLRFVPETPEWVREIAVKHNW